MFFLHVALFGVNLVNWSRGVTNVCFVTKPHTRIRSGGAWLECVMLGATSVGCFVNEWEIVVPIVDDHWPHPHVNCCSHEAVDSRSLSLLLFLVNRPSSFPCF